MKAFVTREGEVDEIVALPDPEAEVALVAVERFDRGIAAKVPQAEWDAICREMEQAFRAGRWRQGALAAVARAGELLSAHFPPGTHNPNELPDAPVTL